MKNLTIEQIIERLEECNIQVSLYKEGKKLCGYELNTYTDCGVNQIVFVDFRDTEMDPNSGKDFMHLYTERVNDIDIDEELKMLGQDDRYIREIGLEIGVQDLKDWKENLLGVFSERTAEQRQFEQVVDKLRSHREAMIETIEMMPKKGDTGDTCQRTEIMNLLGKLDHAISGIEIGDFTPNEYSGEFKLSYS